MTNSYIKGHHAGLTGSGYAATRPKHIRNTRTTPLKPWHRHAEERGAHRDHFSKSILLRIITTID